MVFGEGTPPALKVAGLKKGAVLHVLGLPRISLTLVDFRASHADDPQFNVKASMPHPIRGLLIGPVVAPIAYWIGAMTAAWISDFRFSWFQALRELGVIVTFGLPIAYAAVFVWGAPVLYALHRLGWLRPTTVIVAGAIGGAIVALWFAFDQQGTFFQVKMPLTGGATLGALVGGTCWWAGQGGPKRRGSTGAELVRGPRS